jgi:hypothetical protein
MKLKTFNARKLLAIWAIGLLILTGVTSTMSFSTFKSVEEDWQNGDIVFQDSESVQSEAIKLATQSDYSHCGIVFNLDDKWMVLEAVQPVKVTPINDWIAQGSSGNYTKRRLKDNDLLTHSVEDKMWEVGGSFLNKNYDIHFNWSDERIYCSELVWKIYKRGMGVELGKPKALKEYNLNSKLVREQLKLRYGADIPLNEKMISPQDIFESDLLE